MPSWMGARLPVELDANHRVKLPGFLLDDEMLDADHG